MKSACRRAVLSRPTDRLDLSVRDRIDAVRYENSLLDFIGASWRVVEPRAFQPNWHIEAICEHLEACVDWQIDRLLINMPPRHMKSLGANVFLPAWTWAQDPNPGQDPRYPFAIRRDSWRGPGVKFIHVVDIASAHVAALGYLLDGNATTAFNLANSRGYSVKEVIASAEHVTGKKIGTMVASRRAGDPAILIGRTDRARSVLKWTPQRSDINIQITDAWRWMTGRERRSD